MRSRMGRTLRWPWRPAARAPPPPPPHDRHCWVRARHRPSRRSRQRAEPACRASHAPPPQQAQLIPTPVAWKACAEGSSADGRTPSRHCRVRGCHHPKLGGSLLLLGLQRPLLRYGLSQLASASSLLGRVSPRDVPSRVWSGRRRRWAAAQSWEVPSKRVRLPVLHTATPTRPLMETG